jgi:hypothetical protein
VLRDLPRYPSHIVLVAHLFQIDFHICRIIIEQKPFNESIQPWRLRTGKLAVRVPSNLSESMVIRSSQLSRSDSQHSYTGMDLTFQASPYPRRSGKVHAVL